MKRYFGISIFIMIALLFCQPVLAQSHKGCNYECWCICKCSFSDGSKSRIYAKFYPFPFAHTQVGINGKRDCLSKLAGVCTQWGGCYVDMNEPPEANQLCKERNSAEKCKNACRELTGKEVTKSELGGWCNPDL